MGIARGWEKRVTRTNSWFARDVRDVSIFGHPPCWRPFAGFFKVFIYAIARRVQWSLLKMNLFRPLTNLVVMLMNFVVSYRYRIIAKALMEM